MTPYLFQRGETIILALEVADGDPATVNHITAALKPVPPGSTGIDPNGPVAAQFAISFQAPEEGSPARWLLTLDHLTTATLTAGLYWADARIEAGGGVIVTEPVQLRLRNCVSAA